MYLLGYDIGSSSIKAALVDSQTQETIAVVQYPESEMDMISRQTGWAEQQPEVWWQDVCLATRKLLNKTGIAASEIKSIGLSYQMHGLVLIDDEKHVLRPSIIWCDSRAVAIGDRAFSDLGESWCLTNCLNSPGNFTASKLKWVKDNEPDNYQRIHKFLLPGDFIAMKLTGEIRTTISGLSEGIFWDFKEKKLAQPILEYFGIDEALIPKSTETFSFQGTVTKEAAEMSGLKEGTPLTYRAGDQPTNALALNVLEPGEIAATCGTSGVVYGIVDKPLFDSKSRVNTFAHVNYEDNYDRIGVLLCINGAGMQYSWMKHQIARSGRDYDDMERMASSVPIGSEGLCILPFGNGAERILENKNVNSHLHNLQFNRHNRGHLFRAALEGVAFSFVYGVNILKEMGLQMNALRVGNDNMFRSAVFSESIATLLDCEIEVIDTTAAVGAAKASGVSIGIYNSVHESVGKQQPIHVFEPKLNHALTNQAYAYWHSSLGKSLEDKGTKAKSKGGKENDFGDQLHKLTTAELKLTSKNDLLAQVKQELEMLISKDKVKEPGHVQRIIDQVDKHLVDSKDWESFEKNFEIVNSNFFKKLKQMHPSLSVDEVKLCALIKTNLSTKEIAENLNLSVRGIETRRYRLRRKLEITAQTSLESFLSEI